MQEKSSIWLDELRKERLQSSSRNPGIAALMSFFVMGLGQIYAGHVDRGIMLLGIHISSILSAFSLYNKGIIYETFGPLLGTKALVVVCYFLCVVYILLWIYNIKDAYYLSLFSSFRDWFEVERVLLPMLKAQSKNLLVEKAANSASVLEDKTESAIEINHFHDQKTSSPAAEAEEAAFVKVTESNEEASKEKDMKASEFAEANHVEEQELEQEVYYSDIGSFSFDGQTWKLYTGLVLIFILIGLWFQKKEATPVNKTKPETLFAITADMPDSGSLKKSSADDQVASTIIATSIPEEIEEHLDDNAAGVVSHTEAVPPSPFEKGMKLVAERRYAEACAEFEKDLLVAKPDKATWTIILNTFYRSENRLAYELKLRKYLEAFPDDFSGWFNLGKILYDRSEFAQAAQAIVKGLKAEPDNVRGNFLLGSIYSDLKLYEDAVTYLRKAVAFEPLNVEFLLRLARCLQVSGDKEEAIKYYRRILSLDKNNAEAIAAITEITGSESPDPVRLAKVSEDDQVLVIQGKKTAEVITKTNLPSENVQGKVLFEEENDGKPVGQVVLFESDGEVPPEEDPKIPAIENKTIIGEHSAFEEQALPEKKLEQNTIEKTDSLAKEKIASQVKEEKPIPITADKTEVKKSKPNSPVESPKTLETKPVKQKTIGKNAGISMAEAGIVSDNQDDASLMNAVAIETSGADEAIEALRKTAFKEYSRGNWEKSLPLYLEYLKKRKDPRAYEIVSIIFEKLSMDDDAFEACEHAYKMGLTEITTLNRLGKLAEKTGKFEQGQKYLKKALEKSPHRVDLRIRYARCLAANGNTDDAINELERIVAENSSSYSLKTKVENEIKKIRKLTN
ncbi:MAG: hypothetical protein Kow0029_10430 [Candidatus Rifleibacteriota bacterium]